MVVVQVDANAGQYQFSNPVVPEGGFNFMTS
jgi:hypothetical protein